MPAFVITKLCRGCGTCSKRCPHQAITVVAGLARVKVEACDECEECLEACMQGAIIFKPLEDQKPATADKS